jgi:hypothetical protein
MTTIMLHDEEIAALEAERDHLRARLAKARHHKKPYEAMAPAEYRAALNELGLSIVSSAEYRATPAERHLSPTRSRSCFASPSGSVSPPTISRPSDLTRDITPGAERLPGPRR